MASSANFRALEAFEMSTIYFRFYNTSPRTAHDIASLMHKPGDKFDSDLEIWQNFLMLTARKYIEQELKVTFETGSLGRYLARGHTELVEVRKASKIEGLAEADKDKLDQMKDIFSAHLDCEHPARKNREVWEAAFAQVIENFEAQRVLVEEQLVLYYDFHGLKLETIYAILDLKELAPSSTWDPESKKYLEGLIATAKEKFEEAGGKPKDAQSLARYLARGQIDRMNDLNKATTLTLEERKKIAHLENIDENHEADSNNSEVNKLAAKFITDHVKAYQA